MKLLVAGIFQNCYKKYESYSLQLHYCINASKCFFLTGRNILDQTKEIN